MWRPGAPGVVAVALVLVTFTLVLTSSHPLGARKNAAPSVFPLPEQGGLTLSISGTHRTRTGSRPQSPHGRTTSAGTSVEPMRL